METQEKKVIFSAIQPTGTFTPGNYIGAVRNADSLEPVRTKFAELMNDKAYLKEVYTNGVRAADRISRKTMTKVYRKAGFADCP